jgi:hypothetical protein
MSFELLKCGPLRPFRISNKEKSSWRLLKSTAMPLLNLSHPSNLLWQPEKKRRKMPNHSQQPGRRARFGFGGLGLFGRQE